MSNRGLGSTCPEYLSVRLRRMSELAWRDLAACKHHNTLLFFPERWEVATAARELCAVCPVADDCARYALAHKIEHGIWGGMNVKERRRYARVHGIEIPSEDPDWLTSAPGYG